MSSRSDDWVCGDCRSLNRAKSKRCYRCGVLRVAGEMTDAAAAMTTSAPREARTVQVTADRMGMRYRPTWPLAIIVVALIAVVTWLQFAGMQVANELVGPSGQFIDDKATFDRFIGFTGWHLGLLAVAALAWSCWIALVVANVPSLTTRWPPNSPLSAFFAPYIPIIGLWRPYTVVRGVLTLLTDRRARPQVVALAWWISFLASYYVPFFLSLSWSSRIRTDFGVAVSIGWVRCGLLVLSAVLAIGVVLITERWQWTCARRRGTAVVAAEATAPI